MAVKPEMIGRRERKSGRPIPRRGHVAWLTPSPPSSLLTGERSRAEPAKLEPGATRSFHVHYLNDFQSKRYFEKRSERDMAGIIEMAGRRERKSGRPIPRRGQVKAAIVIGMAHSFASFFSINRLAAQGRAG
ncbi:hypothetical protein AAC387_Pa04g1775 [Persea americana]